MTTPLVKICGITRPNDAEVAARLGADFVGLVFHRPSPRFVDRALAQEVVLATRSADSLCRVVGVFVDSEVEEVNDVVGGLGLDLVQLHGREENVEIARIRVPAIKAVRVGDAVPDASRWPAAEWILFDTLVRDSVGGTGRRFDWNLLDRIESRSRFFLSGGLTEANVAEAIRLVLPDAVDVSSGVESSPGIKDRTRLERFFEAVRAGA